MLEIVYAENIIVGLVKDNRFTWYILDKDDLYDVLYDQLDYVAMSNLIEEYKTTVEHLREWHMRIGKVIFSILWI